MKARPPLLPALRGAVVLLVAAVLVTSPRGVATSDEPEARVDRMAAELIAQDRISEAVLLLQRHLERHPHDRAAEVAQGELQRKRCALASARRTYDRLLTKDLLDPDARAGLAEILLLEGDPEAALSEAALALATPEGRATGGAWRAKTMALIDLGRYRAAHAAAERGVRVAPADPRMLEAYARAAFRAGDMDGARRAYQRVLGLDPRSEEANLRLGSGFGPESGDEAWRGERDAALFAESIELWEAGRLAAANDGFAELCRREPDLFKYRLGLGLVRRSLRRYHEVRFGHDSTAAYYELPTPETPALEAYVKDWHALPEWAKTVIRISTAPARPWLERLVRADASHEILTLGTSLHDAPSRRELTRQRTFDGRLYAHIRGAGGKAAATGIEKLRGAADLAFNTFAHEFAHQLLRDAFPTARFADVKRLYIDAREHGRCLDYYAASNVDEYFAQGYEALVSHAKRGCLRDTGRHTRAELVARDPKLYAFFLEHLDLSHEDDGAALEPFFRALPP